MSKIKIGLFFLMFTLLGNSLYAQLEGEVIPFTRTFPGPGDDSVIRGDMRVIGNSILGIQDEIDEDGNGPLPPESFAPNEEYNGTFRNNGVFRGYIDIDSDASFNGVFTSPLPNSETEFSGAVNVYGSPITTNESDTGTFSSSSAELSINNPLSPPGQTCSTVVKAFLYWGAMYQKESLARGNNDGPDIERPDCTNPDGTPCEFYTEIKILPPGATEYVDIKFNNSGADHTSLKSEVIIDGVAGSPYNRGLGEVRDETYACVADVTSLFTHLQDNAETVEGNWTVANVRAVTGRRGSGSGGGWSLVVVYEDPLATFQKNISMFEGYVAITRPSGQTSDSVEFNITGFETIPAGQVNVDLATISLEGDIGIFGDRFEINDENDDQTKSGNWVGMTYPGQDASNFFDCSIYSKGPVTRFPNSSNTLGYDSDHFTLLNPGNEYISNSDNEADFRIYTEGDAYGNFFNAFAIDVIAPDLDVVKRGFRPDSSEFGPTDEVDLGDLILYEITITNNGNDDAIDITFEDILPINTVFQNNIELNGVPVPLADITSVDVVATDNLTMLSFDTQRISFDIDDSLLEIGESVTVTFTVSVVEDCSMLQDVCTNQIQNQADVTYFGEVNDNNGTLFLVRSAFEVDGCGIGDPGPTVILSDQSECNTIAEDVTQCTDVVELEGGEGFVEYRWFLGGVRLTTDANGAPIDITSNTLLVNQTGIYTLEAIRSTSVEYLNCRDVTTTFDVEVFDPLTPPANPFLALGEPLDPVCADDGTQIIGIQICNDPIEILTSFPDETTYSWQRYDPASGCTQSSQNCPFTSISANCYVEEPNGNESSFILEEEGSYRLSVIVRGGCQFDYFFEAIPIDVTPLLSDPQQSCDDDPVFIVTGVDLTTGNAVNYELEFEVTNQGVSQIVPPDAGTLDRFTLPRVTGEGYTIKGIVTPDIDGSCSFETNEVLFEFIDLSATMTVLTQAECSFDSDLTDTFDPTLADISVTAIDGFPTYIFNLINTQGTATTADDTQVQTSGTIASTTHRFDGIIPANAANYIIEVLAGGTTSSPNCTFTLPVEGVEVPIDFSATANVIKELTCDPAEVEVNIDIISLGTTTDPELTYTILELPGNIYTGSEILFFDDVTNRPASADEDDLTVVAIDGRAINYLDFSTSVELTILISSSPNGACITERQVTINPYDFPTISVVAPVTNIECNGDSTGEIRVEGLTDSGLALIGEMYEIIAGPELRPAQSTPVFSNLPAGNYTIQLTDNENCTITVDQALIEPEALVAPVIETTSFTCDADAIISITTATQGGTIPYSYQLFRDGTLYRTLAATDNASANAALASENLTEGTYDLRVTDDNDCNVVISNELVVNPLPVVALTEVTPRNTDYICTTPGDVPLLEITVAATLTPAASDTVEGYRISSTTDTTGSIAVSAAFTNTTGVFNLPEGTHFIETRTTNTLCTETIEIIVTPYVELTVDAPIITGVECFGDTTGIIEFTVNNFDTTAGYSYDLTFESTSVASSLLETTATITLPALAASNNPNDYVLTVTDLRGDNCTDPISLTATIPGPTEPQIDTISAAYDCTADEYIITITASGGTGSGYTFTTDTPVTTQNSLVFTLPAPATDTTVTVGISDSDSCDGPTTTVDLDAITDLTANLDPSSNLCNIAGTTPTVVVDVTSGEGIINYQLQGTTNIQASTVTSTGQFTIANPEVNPGTYVYEIFDDNHTEVACAVTITYTIDPLFEINGIVVDQPDCSATTPVGSLPTDGSSISFAVEGGDGAYTYAFTPSTVIVANTGTVTNPIFVFDDSFDGDTISITVNDGSGCSLVDAASITVEYPEPVTLETGSPSFAPINCNGEETTLILDPVGADGNFEYSFDGGSSFNANAGESVTAGTINYVVRNITTQCTFEGSVIITEPDPIVIDNSNATDISCDDALGNIPGSYQINVIGGTASYTYELYNDLGVLQETQGPFTLGVSADFQNLDAGSYEVRIIDSLGCGNEDNPIFFNILPTPAAGVISSPIAFGDCTNKVTLYFEVLDGSVDGEDFFVSPTLTGTPIDPSIGGDFVFQLGDGDFPLANYDPTLFDPGNIANRKVYAISNLDFDLISNFIVVVDNITTCSYSREYDTPTSPEVTVVASAINAGACDPSSGAVDITFSTVDSSTVEIEVFRVSDGSLISTEGTRTTIAGVPQTETITGLPVGDLRVRVQQVGPAPLQCNATAPFQISVSPPLEGPIFVSQTSANCNEAAQLEVRANNGNEPYTYVVQVPGTTIADAELLPDTDFAYTESIDFADPTLASFIDATGNVLATVFVRDFNGCTAGPLPINIPAFPAPDVTFDVFATNECVEVGPFTFGYTINNFDASQTYTLTVDGGVEETLPTTPTGTYEVTTRGDHEIIIFGSAHEFCTVTTTVNVPDELMVEANLSEPDCDGNIAELVVEVTGGYDPTVAINRQLTYVLTDGATVIATLNSTSTTETFTSGTGALGLNTLNANINYTISVTDTFDSTVPVGTERTCLKTDTDTKPSVLKPSFVPPTLTGITCGPTTSEFATFGYDGVAQINIAPGYIGSVTYELYEFPAGTSPVINASTYVADIATAGGTNVTTTTVNATVDSLFEGLRGESEVEYITVALATDQLCPVISPLFTIPEPVLFTQGFTVTEVPGTCEPFRSPTISIGLDAVNALDGTAPYFYRITGLANTFTEFNATTLPLEIAANEGTFNVELTDASRCNVISLPITLQEVKRPEATIAGNDAYSCNTPEELVTVTISNAVTGEQYSIINTQFIAIDGTISTPGTIGDSGISPLAVDDFDEDFTLTEPGLYEFTYTNITTGCNETITYSIDELEQISVDAADTEVLCNGDTTSISFEVSDYIGDFDYSFTGSINGQVATGTVSNFGTATPSVVAATGLATIDVSTGVVTVTDLSAEVFTIDITTIETATAAASINPFCNATIEVEVTQPDLLTVGAPIEIDRLSCEIGSSAIIQVGAVTGGTPPYTYDLVRGTTVLDTNDTGVFDEFVIDEDGDPTTASVYFIRVRDANPSCVPVDSSLINISSPVPPAVTASFDPVLCEGDSTSITATVTNLTGVGAMTADVTSLRYALFLYDASAPNFKGSQVFSPQVSNVFNNVFAIANITGPEYLVEVMDDLGCGSTQPIDVVEPTELLFEGSQLLRPMSCNPETEQHQLLVSGGTGTITYERYAVPFTPLTTAADLLETNLTGIFDIVGENYFRIMDANGCDVVTVINTAPVPEPIQFELSNTTTPLCFGETGGNVDIVPNTLSGGVSNYVYNIFDSATSTTPLTSPAVERVTANGSLFSGLQAGTYWYEVTSGACPSLRREFTITQHPELFDLPPADPSIGCPGEDDAIVRLQVDATRNGGGIGPFVYTISRIGTGEQPRFMEVDTNTEAAVFEFLSPGDYVYSIVDSGTNCNGPSGTFTVTEPDPLMVTLDTVNSQEPVCEGQTGTRIYDISGGTPPYYAVLLEDSTLPEPSLDDLLADPVALATYLVPGSDDVLVQPDLASGVATVAFEALNLLENNLYRLLVFDSGNGLTGDDLRLCEPLIFEFEFDTDRLGDYEVTSEPDCEGLDYTVEIENNNPDLDDDDLLIRIFTRNDDGSDGAAVGVLADDETLIMEGVPAGIHNVYLESTITGCTTLITERQFITLEPFTPVQFITLDNEGNEIQPFRATNEINVYQLQVTGGVNPTGLNPYTFEASYVPIETGGIGGIVDVDSDGFFRIDETGFYTFRVIDNFGDVLTCFDLSNSIGINAIDIDVPNVFNPSSGDPLMNTWFPENLTTSFTKDVSPIIDPNPNDGIDPPEVPGLVTTTNGTVTGGTVTGGTTSGGVITGGTTTGGSAPLTVTDITTVTEPNGTINTVSIVTTGGTVDGNGDIIGGTSIITTTTSLGFTTVDVATGVSVTGGTRNSDGTVTGGTITNEDTRVRQMGNNTGSVTTYTIVTGGTIIGGTTTGVTTTGGTTIFSNTTIDGSGGAGFVTTDGITTGGITTGGVTSDAFVTTITAVPGGNSLPTVDVSSGVTVNDGVVTGATIIGATITGGMLSGGERTEEEIEFLDYENMEVFIFDRYGRLLKEILGIRDKSEGREEGWDGTYQGKDMPSGDYWYLIQLNDSQGREFTGHFTLYRR